ncbi:MAG: protein-L-isoaspartate(D-aspartate) O-methyltransferase [candidate division Zixibacteria bacterium]|nr:protein-L-isoaspartate(D-aspartate) O-methyltransferase [candidate division Zixibacteria bacterium]
MSSGNGKDENAQYEKHRERMVDRQIENRGIKNRAILKAMGNVPRHRFVPEQLRDNAYEDGPLPIGYNQTISQPYIVALMSELMKLKGGEKVLEVGTGSGYQAAVLGEIAKEVYTIEIVPELCKRAENILDSLGYDNVHVRCGDGYRGWEEHAPYDAIMVTAAPDHVPPKLVEQLANGGTLVLPVGKLAQELITVTKSDTGIVREDVIPVRFVPMTGEAQDK